MMERTLMHATLWLNPGVTALCGAKTGDLDLRGEGRMPPITPKRPVDCPECIKLLRSAHTQQKENAQ